MPPLSLSVLTWKAPKTLENTLAALTPIAHLFSERYVICQEGDPDEVRIATGFGFEPVATTENLGIQEGLARCGEVPTAEHIMVVEGDNMLTQDPDAPLLLAEAVRQMDRHAIAAFQLQERLTTPSSRFRRYWKAGLPLRPTLVGRMRPGPALARMNEALAFPEIAANGNAHIEKLADRLYCTHSDCLNWSNRPFLTTKSFFLGELVAFARKNPGTKRVNGMPDLEHPVNCPANRHWWRGNRFAMGMIYPGLFHHNRLERPPADEKTEL